MKKLIAKLLQIQSRGLADDVFEAQTEVDEEYVKAYHVKAGYKVGEDEVEGLKTLTQETDFEHDTIEGQTLIQNNSELKSAVSLPVVPETLSYQTFERGYIGTPILNVISLWIPGADAKDGPDMATELTGQDYEEGYMFDLVSVAAPEHYESLLEYLNDNDMTVNTQSELEEIRK